MVRGLWRHTAPHIPRRRCGGRIGRRTLGTVRRHRPQTKQAFNFFPFMSPRDQAKYIISFFFLHHLSLSFSLDSVGGSDTGLLCKEFYHFFFFPNFPFYLLYLSFLFNFYMTIILKSCKMNLHVKGCMKNLLDNAIIQFC